MTLTTEYINKNWRIKVQGYANKNADRKLNQLVGVSGLRNLIGDELAEKFFIKADQSLDDKTTFKLRRGLKVIFYVK